jgi:hypothetical protein
MNVRASSVALWIGILAGPIGWLLTLQAKYALVDTICRNRASWLMWAITIGGLMFCAIGAIAARRGWVSDETRIRFMAIGGLGLSAMFAMAIIAMAVPDLFLGACE